MLNDLSANSIVEGIASGETSAEAVTRACLERISAREREVEAWAHLDPASAIVQAQRRDQMLPHGPLHGVPVGIKDIMDTADLPTEYGSPIYAGNQPKSDAACVALLRAAGAVILGKTVTTEFAAMHPGKTRHPAAADRTPGGSSSGSAAAVADRMVPVALGTQTMGSVIRPAAYCGVVGYKPTYGLINRAGIKPQAESIDTVGIIARSVDDAALLGAVLMGADPGAFDGAVPRSPRIALYRGPDWSMVEKAADEVLDQTARRCAKAGATIEDAGAPPILREALDAHLQIVCYELARAYAFEWTERRDMLSKELRGIVTRGLGVSWEDYLAASNRASAARRWIAETFTRVDLWLTVSGPGEAPVGMATGDPVLNRVWSLLHLPVITLPAGRGPAGLPLGIQLIGPHRRDAEFVRTARWAESVLSPDSVP
jgi:Asp-tRNA(Asn)/Glu-tRNA(Gln) amidotransferase A subunit family amidase